MTRIFNTIRQRLLAQNHFTRYPDLCDRRNNLGGDWD